MGGGGSLQQQLRAFAVGTKIAVEVSPHSSASPGEASLVRRGRQTSFHKRAAEEASKASRASEAAEAKPAAASPPLTPQQRTASLTPQQRALNWMVTNERGESEQGESEQGALASPEVVAVAQAAQAAAGTAGAARGIQSPSRKALASLPVSPGRRASSQGRRSSGWSAVKRSLAMGAGSSLP